MMLIGLIDNLGLPIKFGSFAGKLTEKVSARPAAIK